MAAVAPQAPPTLKPRARARRMPAAWQRRAALVDLDAIAAGWQRALDAAQRAVQLATAPPIAAHVARDARAITNERTAVSAELRRLAPLQENSARRAAPNLRAQQGAPIWPDR